MTVIVKSHIYIHVRAYQQPWQLEGDEIQEIVRGMGCYWAIRYDHSAYI